MIRIISGRFRGLKLPVPALPGLRPTGDRVRESAYNALHTRFDLQGARVLDLFSGAGGFGLEAMSRGAGWVDFVEQQAPAVAHLRRSAERLGGQAKVHRADVLAFLAGATPEAPYDLVLLDPPYGAQLIEPVLQALLRPGWLRSAAYLCVEHGPTEPIPSLPGLQVDFARSYGHAGLTLLLRHEEDA